MNGNGNSERASERAHYQIVCDRVHLMDASRRHERARPARESLGVFFSGLNGLESRRETARMREREGQASSNKFPN